MQNRSLGRSFGNLVLALLNASLILAALCLWLGWKTLSAAERVSEDVTEAASTVLPLRDDIAAMTAEISAARADFAAGRNDESARALAVRLDRVEAQLESLTAAVAPLAANPEALIATAVETAFAELGTRVSTVVEQVRRTEDARP